MPNLFLIKGYDVTFNVQLDALIVEIAPIILAKSIFPLEKIGRKARMKRRALLRC